MNQLKYKVTYGHDHSSAISQGEVEVWAFNILEAIEIANKIMEKKPGKSQITKVEQVKSVQE